VSVTNGTIKVLISFADAGDSGKQAVRGFNAELAKTQTAGGGAAGAIQKFIESGEKVDRLKQQFEKFAGIAAWAAPVVGAVGGAIAAVFSQESKMERLSASVRAVGQAALESRDEIDSAAGEIDRLVQGALDARIQIARLQGGEGLAQQLELEREIAKVGRDGEAARGALARVRVAIVFESLMRQKVAQRELAELEKERTARIQSSGYATIREALLSAVTLRKVGGEDLARSITAAEAAVAISTSNIVSLQDQRKRLTGVIADAEKNKVLPALKAQAAAATVVERAQTTGLKAQLAAAAASSALLKDMGASQALIEQSQRDEFAIRRALGLIEIATTKATLQGEREKVTLAGQQLAIYAAMHGMTAQSARQIAAAGQAAERIGAALGALDRQEQILGAAVFRPEPAKGGKGGKQKKPDGVDQIEKEVGKVRVRVDVDVEIKADRSMGQALEEFFAPGDAWQRRADVVAATFDQKRERIVEASRRTIDELERQRTSLLAAAQDQTLKLSGKERLELRGKAATIGGQVEDERIAQEAAVTKLLADETATRISLREAETSAAMESFAAITAGSLAAYDQLDQKRGVIDGGLAASVRLAGAIAGKWEDIKKGKAGTITAIGEVAAAGIKNERDRAKVMIFVALAETALALVQQRYADAAAGGVSAVMWGIVAGASGGGAAGRAPARQPSQRAGGFGQGGAVIINVNAPWLGQSPQVAGQYFAGLIASTAGTGVAEAA